jgi:outer membrane lipoprotein
MNSLMIPLSLLALTTGCVNSMIPKEVRRQVTPNVAFEQVITDPEAHKGQKVLWGGQILSLKNAKEGTTLHILEIPLDAYGEPVHAESSAGRFIAFTDQYLDRAIFRSGRRITVFGEIQGQRTEPLAPGEMDYRYPLVRAEHVYLWPPATSTRAAAWDPWWWENPAYGPGFNPNFGIDYGVLVP